MSRIGKNPVVVPPGVEVSVAEQIVVKGPLGTLKIAPHSAVTVSLDGQKLLVAKAGGADPMAMRYVAFDGGGEALAGLLGGAIQVYTGDMAEMAAHMDGSLRILGSMSPDRLPAPFAEIPTAKEQGYEIVWPIMRGYYIGKAVSDEDYAKWSDIFAAAHADPEFQKVQAEKGLFPLPLSGAAFDAEVRKQVDQLRGIAVEAGLIAQ